LRILHGREVFEWLFTVSIRSIQLLLLSYKFFPFNFLLAFRYILPLALKLKKKGEIDLRSGALKQFCQIERTGSDMM
jgi:hypothetical protein